jgi:hypothetical protein
VSGDWTGAVLPGKLDEDAALADSVRLGMQQDFVILTT